MNDKKYFSIIEVANILGMSRTAIYKKVKKGEIKAIKIGKTYAIPEDYVKKIMGEVSNKPLTDEDRMRIEKVVKKTIDEYGEVLDRLGDE